MGRYCATLTSPGWKMAEPYRKFSSSSEDWKMTRYISGTSIIRFSSFLAWTGLVSSLLFIIGSLDMILTPLAVGAHNPYYGGCSRYISHSILCGSLYGVGSVTLLINIVMFIYSFKLWKSISSDKMKDMRSLIKAGCYIMGSFELLTTVAAGVVTPTAIIISHSLTSYYGPDEAIIGLLIIPIIISIGVIAIISMMIHGVRKFRPGFVNMYIIFKIVLFTLFAIRTPVQVVMGVVYIGALGWLVGINQLLFCGFFYFYCTGFMVVQYNIMLGRHTELSSLDLSQSRFQFSNNVYFSDDENANKPTNNI